MSKLPSLTPKEVIKILTQRGFVLDRSRGSHQVWYHPISHKRIIIPMHSKDLPKGTLYAILKQADIDKNGI
jgi:predicted RNA binding protein YcfA (HicA-like mRNA interferase family)